MNKKMVAPNGIARSRLNRVPEKLPIDVTREKKVHGGGWDRSRREVTTTNTLSNDPSKESLFNSLQNRKYSLNNQSKSNL